jgi:hypothetical protein
MPLEQPELPELPVLMEEQHRLAPSHFFKALWADEPEMPEVSPRQAPQVELSQVHMA